jgi:hypothetical protein
LTNSTKTPVEQGTSPANPPRSGSLGPAPEAPRPAKPNEPADATAMTRKLRQAFVVLWLRMVLAELLEVPAVRKENVP